MTVPELINQVVLNIGHQFYDERSRDFFRDRLALTKAVARYGYECEQRGWLFEPDSIRRDIIELLQQIKRTGADIGYFPVYLESAISRHIGLRAEELQAEARAIPQKVSKIVNGLKGVEVVRQPSAVETLAILYRDLAARRRRRPHVASAKKQMILC